MEARKVLVVGSGIAGLSTALRLIRRGYEVEIVEKNNMAGGRMNLIEKDGFKFDTGPTFFSMSYEFAELADDIKKELPFELRELDPLYTVWYDEPGRDILYTRILRSWPMNLIRWNLDSGRKWKPILNQQAGCIMILKA